MASKFARTPSGILGMLTLVLLVAFSSATLLYVRANKAAADRTECIARELAQPWVGLKETFAAPPGDTEARARALEAVTRGISRLESLNEHC